jgi:hypothetical protein
MSAEWGSSPIDNCLIHWAAIVNQVDNKTLALAQ